MAIVLGNHVFDETRVKVEEKHEEIGGRDARVIGIRGVIEAEDVDAALDAVMQAASADNADTVLSLRSGRVLRVRRTSFTRELLRQGNAASFVLILEANDPFEHAMDATLSNWSIAASGATHAVAAGGNVFSWPVITITAAGDLVRPSFSDGEGVITYDGTLADGESLVFDAPAARLTLDGEEVTPYVSGAFPRIHPEGTTLVYTDDAASSHTASVTVSWHDRWW